jgi:hypothetical protein
MTFANKLEFEAHFLEMHAREEDRVIPCSVVSSLGISGIDMCVCSVLGFSVLY